MEKNININRIVENKVRHIFNKLNLHGKFHHFNIEEGYAYDDEDSTPDTYMPITIADETPYAFLGRKKIRKYEKMLKYTNKELIKKYNIMIW